MLLEDGSEVSLGHVVGKGAVTKDHLRFAHRGQLLVPGDDAERQRLHLGAADLGGKADQQSAGAYAVNGLVGEDLLLDRHGDVLRGHIFNCQ